MVTGATDINADPGCDKAIDLDMAPGYNSDPDISMVSHGSTGHPALYGPGDVTLKHRHGLRAMGLCIALCSNRSH